MPIPASRILLRMRLLRELVGKEFPSTEHMEFEAMARIEDIVGERAYLKGYYSVPEYGVTVLELESKDMVIRIYYIADVGKIKIVWVDVGG
jgi:hypothetical protein